MKEKAIITAAITGSIHTPLAVSGLVHANAYKHIFWGHVVATTISLFVAIPMGLMIYG
jgi:hypothetical protein